MAHSTLFIKRSLSAYLPPLWLVLTVICVGCATRQSQKIKPVPVERPIERSERFTAYPMIGDGDQFVPRERSRLPWEAWPLSHDLQGRKLRNIEMLEGDEFRKIRRTQDALQRYLAARSAPLSVDERDALTLRIASTYLALDKADSALRTLSDYFRATGRTEESVSEYFSLIFAYGYGRKGSIDQSLAWFSQVNRTAAGRGGMSEAAGSGARLLLRALPNDDFYKLSKTWASDSFVHRLVGEEARRRSLPDFVQRNTTVAHRFWELDPLSTVNTQAGAYGERQTVGVLLPLTGKFSRLGVSTREGIELALLGQDAQGLVELDFRDTVGDPANASAQLRAFLAQGTIPVVLGPLLSEVAGAVTTLARSYGLPVLAFSKRSYFETGNGIFRLGPTVETQVDSLLEVVYQKKGLLRYAIVAPEGAAGAHYAEVFRDKAEQLNLDIVYDTTYVKGDDAGLAWIATELQKLSIQAVFFPDSLTLASRFFGNFSREQREKVHIIGLGMWDNSLELAHSRTVMEGAIFVSPFFAGSKRPVVGKFVEAYRRKYGRRPDFLAAQGFDAATLMIAALKRHKATDIPFMRAIHQINTYEGLTGEIHIAPGGELQRRFAVVELHRGKLQEIEQVAVPNFVMRGDTRLPDLPKYDSVRASLSSKEGERAYGPEN